MSIDITVQLHRTMLDPNKRTKLTDSLIYQLLDFHFDFIPKWLCDY
jgi:hypothetical protein